MHVLARQQRLRVWMGVTVCWILNLVKDPVGRYGIALVESKYTLCPS